MASKLSEAEILSSAAKLPTSTPLARCAMCLIALITSAVAFYFGTGLHPLWPFIWVAPIPLLITAPRVGRSAAIGIAFVAFAGGALNEWHYAQSLTQISVQILMLFLGVPSVAFALGILLYRRFVLRAMPLTAVLSLPSLWVAYEYTSALGSPHSTFGNLGYTQINFLAFIQLTSLTGIWGLSFFVFLFASTVAVLLNPTFPIRARRNIAVVTVLLYLTIFSYGVWRLRHAYESSTVRVALAASDTRDNLIATKPQTSIALFQRYAARASALAAQGAKIIILPEHTAIVTDDTGPNTARDVDALFASTAAASQAFILIGVDRATASAHYNESRLYAPTGGLVATYHKQHLLPPFENVFTPGTALTTYEQPSGLWGMAICKDMDFPKLSRQYGDKGVGLLLVPAWDFNADGWLHGRMAILRGVESGFSIARSAKQGILTVSDDRGRVLAQRETTTGTPFVTLVADVPVRHSATLYNRFGDWFANLNLALFACCLLYTSPSPRDGL